MAIASPAALVALLRQSGLLEPAQLAQLPQALHAHPHDAQQFAGHLVVRGWLTAYQSEQLLRGQADDLVLGQYVILEAVGKGRVGDVFRARHQQRGHEVALKVIHADLRGDLQVLQRFRREVQALSRLAHPNLIRACDVEEVGTAHFYAMEYIAGVNLNEVLERVGQVPIAPACDYIRQAALGLQHAHENGLIHRDIKPANLLLAPAEVSGPAPTAEVRQGRWGTVKLLDLGLALVDSTEAGADEGPSLTLPGFMLGTVDYMAPEQVLRPHEVDIRADVYGLGCTFYHMLAGRPPFPDGALIDKLNRHRTHEPTSLEELRPEVPTALSAVVRKMMAKRPEERYQTPAELAEVLDAVFIRLDEALLALDWQLPGSPPPASASSEPQRVEEEAEPSMSLATAALGALLFLGSFLLFWLLFGR